MDQPPDFIHQNYSSYVCKLSKAIYDFKQAPCAFDKFNSFLLVDLFEALLILLYLFVISLVVLLFYYSMLMIFY